MRSLQDFTNILGFMASRDFLKVSEGIVKVDNENEKQSLGQSFLYNLVLPFVETYWITLAYFAVQQNRMTAHDEENLYQKIQWLLETFYSESGILKFYESCMLESIKNAVKRFISMGVLTKQKVTVKRNVFKTYVKVTDVYQNEHKIAEILDQIGFYLPYSAQADLSYFSREMRKLTISEIQVVPSAHIAKL